MFQTKKKTPKQPSPAKTIRSQPIMAGQPKPPSLTYPFSAVEGFHSRPRMAKPPNLTGEGVAWPDVVALQAQVRSKETSSGRYGRVALRLGCDCFGIWEFVG